MALDTFFLPRLGRTTSIRIVPAFEVCSKPAASKLLLFAWLLMSFMVGTAGAQTHYNQISYRIVGEANASSSDGHGLVVSETKPLGDDQLHTIISSQEELDGRFFDFEAADARASARGATASVDFQMAAKAGFGALRVDLYSEIDAATGLLDEGSSAILGRSGTNIPITASASWYDTFTASAPSQEPGTLLVINSLINVHGSMNASALLLAGAKSYHRGWAQTTVALTGVRNSTTVALASGRHSESSHPDFFSIPNEFVPIPEEVPYQTLIVAGQENTIGFTLTLTARGAALSGLFCGSYNHTTDEQCAGNFHSSIQNLFGETVTWGGITSVQNALTGEPILDWEIVSASGFDYAHPYTVPETGTFSLFTFAIAGSVGFFRPRR